MQIFVDEIVSIEKIGVQETIDIEVSGDNLFFANDILTHNSGFSSSDISLTDTSESIGLPQTADLMLALISTEELEGLNQILVKQLKNRYGALDPYRRFTVGIDRAKMRLYDVEQEAQDTLVEIVDLEPEKKDFKSKFKNFNFD
jgi:hypothetical protein